MTEELKMGADGLEVVAYHRQEMNGLAFSPQPSWDGCTEDWQPLCRLTDAQRLLSQLREELAQRDAEVKRLKEQNRLLSGPEETVTVCEKGKPYSFMAKDPCRYGLCEVTYAQPVYALIEDRNALRARLAALESQQAASVDGERDEQAAFEHWLDRANPSGDVEQVQAQWEASADYADFIDALSPAGGGVVMPAELTDDMLSAMKAELDKSPVTWCRYKAAYRSMLAVARLNAKPQANSQEAE